MIPEPLGDIVCLSCFATVKDEFLVQHVRWHEREEKKHEAAISRLWLLERHRMGMSPTGDPQGHHHQAE